MRPEPCRKIECFGHWFSLLEVSKVRSLCSPLGNLCSEYGQKEMIFETNLRQEMTKLRGLSQRALTAHFVTSYMPLGQFFANNSPL